MDTKNIPVLLLSPWMLNSAHPALDILEITKKDKLISFNNKPLDWPLVRKMFRDFPKPARDIMMDCSLEALTQLQQDINKLYQLQRNEITYEFFTEKALVQFWHKMFDGFKPYFPLVKWYHRKVQPGKKKYLTAPCSFTKYRPSLSFEVIQTDGKLQLQTLIIINGAAYPLEGFTRSHFLLESKNEYFILSLHDYRTLQKLKGIDYSLYAHSPELFSQHVLTEIEGQYPVNRHNLFPVKEISITPINRILLTELNNSFLMLTPQWVYDSNIIDGEWKENFEVIKEGTAQLIKRNKQYEEAFVKTVEALHPNFPKQRNGYFYLSFADAQKKQWFLKVYHQLLQMDIEVVGMDMLQHFRYSPHPPATAMELLSENQQTLVYKMEVSFGKEKVGLAELQKMLLAGQKAVLLKDGSLGILNDDWMARYAALVKHGKIKQQQITLLRWMAVTEQQSSNAAMGTTIQESWWKEWKRWQKEDDQLYPLPPNLEARLRPYQQKGYEWLLLLQKIGAGACLADDMGLGKTLQSISVIAAQLHRQPQSKIIIVCPASLLYNWQQELGKFTPSANVLVYHGAGRQKEALEEAATQVIITTYNTMRSDADLLGETFYDIAIIDESHNIKNPSTQITQAVMKLNAGFRLALSGTPVVNNTFDLYSQLNFSVPGLFGSREFFKREYADPIDYRQDEEKIAALKKMTASFILRRTKEQVAKDLPEKTEAVLWCDMGMEQREVYNAILEQTRSSIFLEIKTSGLAKTKLSILQGMTRLRQACASPLLLPEEDRMNCSDSVKADVLMDELSNILGNHKALVFSQFSSMLDLLAEKCNQQGIAYYHFNGQTAPSKRTEMINQFQDPDNKVNLFLISLKAGNAGITLTAADYVFLFDPWWNTAVQDQAVDRTHRIGQTKNVFAYKMICKNSIEEKIILLQQKKKKLSEELISADDGFVKTLTEEDVAYLFG